MHQRIEHCYVTEVLDLGSGKSKPHKLSVVTRKSFSSREEFIEHAIEKELAHYEEGESKDDVLRKLKGLGYIE